MNRHCTVSVVVKPDRIEDSFAGDLYSPTQCIAPGFKSLHIVKLLGLLAAGILHTECEVIAYLRLALPINSFLDLSTRSLESISWMVHGNVLMHSGIQLISFCWA